MIVRDASVIIDRLLPKMRDRYKKSSELLETISKGRIAFHAPIILKIELSSVLGFITPQDIDYFQEGCGNDGRKSKNGSGDFCG